MDLQRVLAREGGDTRGAYVKDQGQWKHVTHDAVTVCKTLGTPTP